MKSCAFLGHRPDLSTATHATHATATYATQVIGGERVPSGASFGFKIGPGATFDVAYSLTLVRTSSEPLNPNPGRPMGIRSSEEAEKEVLGQEAQEARALRQLFKSMACSFVIAAAGPAQPDVRAEPFNGATCLWERNEGVGENYQVDFSPEDLV